MMVKRLLEVKAPLKDVLAELDIDSLLVAEWSRLEELSGLLEPFAVQTDNLQTDTVSLSLAIPCILDLQCHLQSFPHSKVVTRAMLSDMNKRFACLLDPSAENFIPLPAASCLLDPSVAAVLLTPEMTALREAAKKFIINEVCYQSCSVLGLPPVPDFAGYPGFAPCCPASRQDQPRDAKCPAFQGAVKMKTTI